VVALLELIRVGVVLIWVDIVSLHVSKGSVEEAAIAIEVGRLFLFAHVNGVTRTVHHLLRGQFVENSYLCSVLSF
jgi:hypothetical protein